MICQSPNPPKPLSPEDVALMEAARAAVKLAVERVGWDSAADALQMASTLARRGYRQNGAKR